MVQQSEKFTQAFEKHNSGQLTDARDMYLEILQKEPENAQVWGYLGVLYYQVKRLYGS